MGAALPVISAVGTIGGLLASRKANKQAGQQLGLQKQAAAGQQQLFNTASPYYSQLLEALGGTVGLGAGAGAPNYWQASQLPYTNVTPQQLGVYANPADALRLRAAEDYTRQGLHNALGNFSFTTGMRGLGGSSLEASGRSALLGHAQQTLGDFARQLAINAPQEYVQRLGSLGGMLNPGLGAGPAAGQLFGQGAQTFGQMGANAGAGVANTISAYLQARAMGQGGVPKQQQNYFNKFKQAYLGGEF